MKAFVDVPHPPLRGDDNNFKELLFAGADVFYLSESWIVDGQLPEKDWSRLNEVRDVLVDSISEFHGSGQSYFEALKVLADAILNTESG